MHNCLHISEIITRIFSQLVVTQDDGISVPLYPGTLAALGRTCRAFHEPALNALWSTQGSILSLLLCMPSDLWEKRDGCLVCYLTYFSGYADRNRISIPAGPSCQQTGADYIFMRDVSNIWATCISPWALSRPLAQKFSAF